MRWPMSPVSAGVELGAFCRRRLTRKPSDATSCEPIAHRRFQILPDSSSCVQMLPDSSPKKLKKIRIPNPPLAVCLWQGADRRHRLALRRGPFEPRAAARGRACARQETVRPQTDFLRPQTDFLHQQTHRPRQACDRPIEWGGAAEGRRAHGRAGAGRARRSEANTAANISSKCSIPIFFHAPFYLCVFAPDRRRPRPIPFRGPRPFSIALCHSLLLYCPVLQSLPATGCPIQPPPAPDAPN